MLLVCFSVTVGAEDGSASPAMVEVGKRVSVEYSIELDDGTVVESNAGKDPLIYVHGENQLFPILEQALAGLRVNDTKTVKLPAEDGFGPVNADAFLEVELETIPEEARQVGMLLATDDPASGNEVYVRVHEVREDKIVLDLNHPLAGKDLRFNVRIIAIE
jgi:FKBP-type peptidyl-prolyl cis-trans isomerase 2